MEGTNNLECLNLASLSCLARCNSLAYCANQDESPAKFCRQVAAWVPDIFSNFYFVKSYEIANNSATAEARENRSTDLESLEF